ncbi:hypothetical protein RRG08_064778 [Elysia crispata]|uniref:PiggyBac transposable element-derived protein domain-containing protein n=1 Tax=Elysia crispata TaxID=231223 RepID=A0AAE0Z0Q9_9GAST|nr:hypothetical protein RRG08_064778 [Elysia crispata]
MDTTNPVDPPPDRLNNLDGTSEALEFFFALLDEEVQDDLIKEINAYAEVQIQKNTPLTKHSRYRDWEPIDRYQLSKFLAVLIAMGMDPRPYISDFWSTNGRLYTPWYEAVMFPRRKFQIVYHSMLHSSVTGYVYNLLIYFGKDTSYIPENDANSSQAVKISLEPSWLHFSTASHHIFADRYYTSQPQ